MRGNYYTIKSIRYLNPFVSNAPFMYLLKTLGTLGALETNGLKRNNSSEKNNSYIKSRHSQYRIQSYFKAGIPVWDPELKPQTLKSVDFWCKLSSTFLVAEPRERCFELFRTQNSQKYLGFCPWTPLGRAYSAAPDSPAARRFFSSLRSSKNRHPQKFAGYGTDSVL